jgi:hypothetical protein
MKIFADKKDNVKLSLASENTGIFISKDLFIQALKGLGKKDKAEIPTMLTE